MTEIHKPIVRRTRQPLQRWGVDAKKIVIEILPIGGDDAIKLRLERRRQGYTIMVDDLYRLMVRQAVMNRQMERLRAKIGRGGKRKVARK